MYTAENVILKLATQKADQDDRRDHMSFSYLLNQDTCARVETHQELKSVPATEIVIRSYEVIDQFSGEDRLVFDLVNAPPPYANALRRTLLSWVPSIAIEDIYVCDNTGIMPDEILAHRIGLIPLNVHPNALEQISGETDPESTDPNTTLLFGMNVIGGTGPDPDLSEADWTWENRMPPVYTGPDGMVTSDHLIWLPFPGQRDRIPPITPLHRGVPITKLRPGQTITLYARAVRSNTLDHAKYQAVSTAFYKFVPRIEVSPNMPPRACQDLVQLCPKKVFDIEDSGIVVKNPRACSACRECLRAPRFSSYLKVGKEAGVVEFTVESVGVRPAPELVVEALNLLRERCNQVKEQVEEAAEQLHQ